MDRPPDASPPSPSSSDSDSYNTESARVYFGPLKTPERNFVAASQRLFPPPQAAMLRRSPRLSSPRLRSVSPMDTQAIQEDIEDIEQVALLVNESGDESEDVMDSQTGTPQRVDYNPDEPSSVLADKIIHALDNPSPPPSPPSALRIFDPYHTSTPEITADYQSDLMFLSINDGVERDDEKPLLVSSVGTTPDSLLLQDNVFGPTVDDTVTNPEELISFDLPLTPLPGGPHTPDKIIGGVSLLPPQATLSVDDLLSQSPSVQQGSSPQSQKTIPGVTVEPPLNEVPTNDFAMSVDNPAEVPQQDLAGEEAPQLSAEIVVVEEEGSQSEQPIDAIHPNKTDSLPTTPLRRSTRPRRSVTPNVIQDTQPIPRSIFPPPSATRIKKVVTATFNDEIVSDSQDDEDVVQASTSHVQTPTSTTIRVRHRSPGKAPLSFRRELGSLSPTSSNLLSTLNFTGADEQVNPTDQPEPSSGALPMFSFSVFTPPTETPAPSTPLRSTGPLRFASPSKSGASPNKYTLQTPAAGDPTNTPARRVPIAQAIAQGRVSPEKATLTGFRFNGTPLPSVPTPARRVLISEGPPSLAMKSSTLRFGSPAKSGTSQRESSAEPIQRLGSSVKGKEKAAQPSYQLGATLTKLPFPLVPATPVPAELSMPSAQASSQDNLTKSKVSPGKSSLRQPTSRIPRIGAKPYARTVDPKITERAKTATTIMKVDLTKPSLKSSTSETASSIRKNVRAVEFGKGYVSSSTPRVKSTASTSTAVLKRKREPEKVPPAKPRVIMLRQVPQVVIPPVLPVTNGQSTSTEPAASKAKKPASGPRQIRRVMDPEPKDTIIVKPPLPQQTQPSCVESEKIANASNSQPPVPEPTISNEPYIPPTHVCELVPGSPMRQDPPRDTQRQIQQQPVEEQPLFSIPEIVIEAEDSSTSGLRRTTRSKRVAAVRDVFTEGSSRPAPVRRKPAAFRSDDVFSGMSMTALKDLTISNTVKNQRYLTAKLETEVVRKEGLRPESPAVKVRTIVQRQQEEKDRQRAERAKRRSRRSDEMAGSSDIDADDAGYSSQMDELMDDSDADEPKYRRGAGEEDDYETPEVYSRHFKRTRLFGEASDIREEPQPQRRVKWDRGLFTTVYLDEVKLGSRQYLKENRDLKGILAPNAKALRLDTLGNLPHADSPLGDLVQENVTVKKIVYDDDVPAVPEIVVKPTRTKTRRK